MISNERHQKRRVIVCVCVRLFVRRRRDGVDATTIEVCERWGELARAFESEVATFQSLYHCETQQPVSFVSDNRSEQQVIRPSNQRAT